MLVKKYIGNLMPAVHPHCFYIYKENMLVINKLFFK